MPLMSYAKKLFQKIDTAFSFDLLVTFFVIALLVYGKSLFNGFVGDDDAQILSNETVKNASQNFFIVFGKGTFANGGAVGGLPGVYYKPFMTLCFAFLYSIFGPQPFGFHLFSLLVHILNSILLFFIARTFFRFSKFQYSQMLAFFLSLLFLVSPGISETVFYIASLQDVLVTTFLFVSIFIMQKMQSAKKIVWQYYAMLLMSLFLGLFSKEAGIVALALVVVYAWFFIRKSLKWIIAIDLIVFSVYLYLRLYVAHISVIKSLPFIPIHEANLWQRILTMPFELFSYVRLIVFPFSLFLYEHSVVLSLAEWKFFAIAPVIFLILGILLYAGLRLKSNVYWFFLWWLFFGFGILMNIIPLDMTMAERWLSVPIGGVLLIIFFIVYPIWRKWRYMGSIFLTILIVYISFYAVRTFIRGNDWKDNATLFGHDIKENPYSYELLDDYAVTLSDAKNYNKAQRMLDLSIQLSPKYWPAYSNKGAAYERSGNIELAKRYDRLAIGLSHYFVPYINLAELTFETESPQNTLFVLQEALAFYPNNPNLLMIAAKTYDKLGKEELAKAYAQKAVELDSSVLQDPVIQRLLGQN